MKKIYSLLAMYLACCAFVFNAQAQTIYPYFPDTHMKDDLADVATVVADPASFVVDPSRDFTLEVNGTAGTLIQIVNDVRAYEYTPAGTSKVRFVKRGTIVYVYEDAVYKTSINLNLLPQFPGIRAEADNSTAQTGIYNAANLLDNPGFETRVAIGTSTTRFKDGVHWDTYNDAKTLDWGTGTNSAIRNDAAYVSEGAWTLIMHQTTRYLTQNVGRLKPNTYYQLSYDYWTSSAASTNGGAAYNILLGTEQFSGNVATLAGPTTSLADVNRRTFTGMFKTPETLTEADVWLTLHRPISKVDWMDRFSLLETTSTTIPTGITGTTGTVLYVEGTAYAPLIELDEAAGDVLDMTQFILNPSFESNFTSWTNSGMATQTNTAFNPFKQGNVYVERWVSTNNLPLPDVSVRQTISGLPNGNYILRAAAHNTLQTGMPGAFIFANTAQTEVGERAEYAVNFMVVDGTAVIGFKTVSSEGNWAAVDNFRLHYKGFKVDLVRDRLQELKDAADVLLTSKMKNPVRAELVNYVNLAAQALSSGTAGEELTELVAQLQNAIQQAEASVATYAALQSAIDDARALYGDGSGNQADALLAVIVQNETLADNLDAEAEALSAGVAELNAAVYAFRLANATEAAPVVTTNPNYARGATAAFGRSSFSVPVADLLEHGFVWSTHPEPTINDNKTTKHFSNTKGIIYHLENLQPATVYYMRAYAISQAYAVGYGDVIQVTTIPKGTVTYQLNNSVLNSGEHHPRIASAMESAVKYFNDLTSIQGHHLSVNYNAGTPTAEASYGGYIQFGANPSFQRTGTALHEMGHTIGVGQHQMWYGPNSPLRATGSSGVWLGERANKVVQFLENNPTETLRGDGVHMWPYGINGAHEDTGSELLYIGNALIHQALGEDGLPPTRNTGLALPTNTFKHNPEAKYYIKTEELSGGNTFLAENAAGQLENKTLSPTEVMADESAAWYFSFNPATGLYQIRNAASGKYFTYQGSGLHGINLTSVTTPTHSNAFQLLGARYTTQIGEGTNMFPVKAYWIVRQQAATTTPPTLVANENGSTSMVSLDFRDAATSQRWMLLSADDVQAFETLLNRMPTGVENPHIASGDAKVTLTWDFMYGMKYDVLRSESENGTYTAIATDVNAVRYEDMNRENNRTYFYKIVAHNTVGRSPETQVLAGTPKHGQHLFLDFNEATGKAVDAWGGYHGTLASAARRETAPNGQALRLDGSADAFVSLPTGIVSTLTDFTIATWAKVDALATWMRIFDFGTGTTNYMFLTVQANTVDGKSTVRYTVRNGSSTGEKQVSFAYAFPLNTWTHFAVTQSGNVASLYINGEKVATNTDFTLKPADLGVTNQNYLGKSQWPDPMFRGSIDEFRIYNFAVSEANIANLANNLPLSSRREVNANVQVYPNPATSVINVSGLDAKAYQYQIYNLVGSKVAEGTLRQGQITLPATMANGNYILQLTDNDKTDIRKHIVIQK